jgi:hypothetical protein
VLPRASVSAMAAATVSLMPATFDALGEDGLADLLEFLARKAGG